MQRLRLTRFLSALGVCLVATIGVAQYDGPATQPAADQPLREVPVTITIDATPRQTFKGFGTSQNKSSAFANLPQHKQELMSKLIFKDLGLKVLRLWFIADWYESNETGERDLSRLGRIYGTSKMVEMARQNGVEQVIMSPTGMPKKYRGEKTYLAAGMEEAYADLIASGIAEFRDKYGVVIDGTGIQNEPGPGFAYPQMVELVKHLRRKLDERGLQNTRIIAPEGASVDHVIFKAWEAFKADREAYDAVAAIGAHSYNMGATTKLRKLIEETGKEYWQTEAGNNGRELPDDYHRGVTLAFRALNDLNQGTSWWVWFLGAELNDPKDDATRLIRYWTEPEFKFEILKRYWYLQQLSQAFPPGSVMRYCRSSLPKEEDMVHTYGIKPHLTAAVAVRPDGRLAIGIANGTSHRFNDPKTIAKDFDRDNRGRPAAKLQITIELPPELGLENAVFKHRRSNAEHDNAALDDVNSADGQIVVSLVPGEAITLVSSDPATSIDRQ